MNCTTLLEDFLIWSYLDKCGGTGIDTTLPTNTVQVQNTTGTVTDSGSVYTGLLGVISKRIYIPGTGQVNCEPWPVDRLRGWNAGLTDPAPMCGGGGEVQVTSVETHGQPDAGWLAATPPPSTKSVDKVFERVS